MKRIGMIGGFGPESTLEYCRLMIETYREHKGTSSLQLFRHHCFYSSLHPYQAL